jgi:hypothetical protein
VVGQDRPAAVVFLGDLQAQRPLEIELASILGMTEVWYIHGNHDTDSEADYDNLFGSALADRNLHGRVVEIDGLRIAGLGGIFRGQVWAPPGEWLHERPRTSPLGVARATCGAAACRANIAARSSLPTTSAWSGSAPTSWSRTRPPLRTLTASTPSTSWAAASA